MSYLQDCFNLDTPKLLECYKFELSFDFQHDLHHEQANDEKVYIKKMLMSTIEGKLWGGFIVMCRVS